MTTAQACQLLERVTDAISEIDQECCTLRNGIEHGLVNIKLEYQDRAIRETGKKLTEELLLAWLVQQKLSRGGWPVNREESYPGGYGQKCDLVIPVAPAGRLWLELKLAWKAWFNCQGEPTCRNRNFLPYLQGIHHTHSFRHDFKKLGGGNLPNGDGRAVCLIGFDMVQNPMDAEVAAVVQAACEENGPWVPATKRLWSDRRCRDFRIGVWSWVLAV